MPASRPPATSGRILVINPNSNREVTEHMSRALEGLRFAGGPAIDCLTLAAGPPGVESERDVARAAAAIVAAVERERRASGAFVVACFSDPGLHAAREAGRRLKERGADVLVMGCAGMARYRPALEQALEVPVIDPTQAATAMALLALRNGRP